MFGMRHLSAILATAVIITPSVAQDGAASVMGNGNMGTNLNSCPGTVWTQYCCIGQLGGPGVSSLASSIALDVGSVTSALPSDLGAITNGLDGLPTASVDAVLPTGSPIDLLDMSDFAVGIPTVTAAAQVRRGVLEKRDETSIADGVTCYGSAIDLSASPADFSSQLAAATSASAAQGDDFTRATGAAAASGSGSDDDTGTDISTATDSSNASGGAESTASDDLAPQNTAAALLLGGMVGAIIYGAM